MLYSDHSRCFRLWEYTVSHSSLLLRSPKGSAHSTSLDLMFVGVEYVRLPASLGTLDVSLATNDDLTRELGEAPSPGSAKGYLLGMDNLVGMIVAAGFTISEHDKEHMWSPFDLSAD